MLLYMPNTATFANLAVTESLEQAVCISALLSLIVGLPLNFLLCWVIIWRSSEELRVYRKVLLQTAVVDTAFLLVSFLVQPAVIADEGRDFLYGLGAVMRASAPATASTSPRWLPI